MQLTVTMATQRLAASKQEQRRSEIVKILMDAGSVPIKELAGRLGVSFMTVHRDVNDLQERGFVRRIRGAVSAEKSMLFESSYLYRTRQNVEAKRRLARTAVRHIEPGDAIVWDDSSTAFHVTDVIERVAPVTVITNALPVMERLQALAGIDLIALGGRYNRSYAGFFGLGLEKSIRSLHVDVALLSTTTVQGLSLFTQDEQVVRAKQAMIEIARKRLLLVDASKFGYSALHHVADLTDFDLVLIAGSVDEAIVARMRAGGVSFEFV
jgi:DeoR/GlpR family transcriptional regulator of sugar metabolism